MRAKPLASRASAAVALLIAAGLLGGCGGNGPGGVAVWSGSGSTNQLASAAPQQIDGLRRLEEQLSKALEPISHRSSLENSMPQPRRLPPVVNVVIPKKESKEERDRRLEWMLLDSKDTPQTTPLEDLLELSSKQKEQPKKNSLEEFYDRLNQERERLKANKKPSFPSPDEDQFASRQDATSKKDSSARDDNLFGEGNGPGQLGRLRQILGLDQPDKPADNDRPRGIFGGLLGSGKDDSLSPQQIKEHQEYLDRFREVLPGSAMAAVANPLDQFNPLASLNQSGNENPGTKPKVYGDMSPFSSPSPRDLPASSPDSVNSFLTRNVAPDLNGSALNQWNPFYSPPKYEAPKPTPLTAPPMMEVPRRRF